MKTNADSSNTVQTIISMLEREKNLKKELDERDIFLQNHTVEEYNNKFNPTEKEWNILRGKLAPISHRPNIFIDANILHKNNTYELPFIEQIKELSDLCIITLLLAHSVKAEILHPNTPVHVKKEANMFLSTVPVEYTYEEIQRLHSLVNKVRELAREENIDTDLFHIAEAAKYGSRYFITCDKRMLSRSDKILQEMQIEVIKPSEFINRIII